MIHEIVVNFVGNGTLQCIYMLIVSLHQQSCMSAVYREDLICNLKYPILNAADNNPGNAELTQPLETWLGAVGGADSDD